MTPFAEGVTVAGRAMGGGRTKMDLPIDATVSCDDGQAGSSEAVIVEPLKRTITHFVLRERAWPHTKRLIPVSLVSWTTEDEIHLGCSLGFARKQEPFFEAHERVPIHDLAIRRGTEVVAADGRVGKVEAFLVDTDDEHITHVVVRSGHVVQREFAVPVSGVASIREDRVVLRLSRRDVEELPHVPYHEISLLPGIDKADSDVAAVSPEDVGVEGGSPDASHVEAAHLLADEAAPRLESRGFTRDQILEWADQYESAGLDGGVEEFIDWIDRQERARRS